MNLKTTKIKEFNSKLTQKDFDSVKNSLTLFLNSEDSYEFDISFFDGKELKIFRVLLTDSKIHVETNYNNELSLYEIDIDKSDEVLNLLNKFLDSIKWFLSA